MSQSLGSSSALTVTSVRDHLCSLAHFHLTTSLGHGWCLQFHLLSAGCTFAFLLAIVSMFPVGFGMCFGCMDMVWVDSNCILLFLLHCSATWTYVPASPWPQAPCWTQDWGTLTGHSAESREKESRKQVTDDVLSSPGLYLTCVGCSWGRCEQSSLFPCDEHWIPKHYLFAKKEINLRYSLLVTPEETLLFEDLTTDIFMMILLRQ